MFRLFTDSMLRFKGTVFLVILADFAGISLQITAIGQGIYYARLLEKGGSFSLRGIEFDPRSSLQLLFLFAIGIMSTMLISAGITYFARSKSLYLSRIYEELCIRRALRLTAASKSLSIVQSSPFVDDIDMMRLLGSDARLCGRSFLRILILFIPMMTFIFSLGVLLWTNYILSIFLLIPTVLFSIMLMKANRLAASSFLGYEQSAIDTAAEKRGIIERLKGLTASTDQVDTWVSAYFKSGQIKNNLDCYEQFLRTTETSHLINTVMLSIGMFIILLFLGWKAILQNSRWSDLMIYLVAFRYTSSSMRQVSANVIALSRFYPQIKRFFAFLDLNESYLTENTVTLNDLKVMSDRFTLTGNLNSVELKPGARVGIISPIPLNLYNVTWMMAKLSEDGGRVGSGSLWFATSTFICPKNIPLRQCLGLEENVGMEEILSDLRDTAHYNSWHQELSDIIDRPVTLEQWKMVDPGLKFLLATFAGQRSEAPVVFLDEKGLREVPDKIKKRVVDHFFDRIVFIVFHDDLSNTGNYDENAFAVLGETGLLGLSDPDWISENHDEIRRLLMKATTVMARQKVGEDLGDEIDIMNIL
jgi:ABC-type multidrug transport system fused ATPase/permease subunit